MERLILLSYILYIHSVKESNMKPGKRRNVRILQMMMIFG